MPASGLEVILSPNGGRMLQPVIVVSRNLGEEDSLAVVGMSQEDICFRLQSPALQFQVP